MIGQQHRVPAFISKMKILKIFWSKNVFSGFTNSFLTVNGHTLRLFLIKKLR